MASAQPTRRTRRAKPVITPAPPPRKAAPEGFVFSGDVDPLLQTWLWDRRIPQGALTLLAGAPGASKSSLLIDVAVRVSKGTLPGDFLGQPQTVMYLTREDSVEGSLKAKLLAAGDDGNVLLPSSTRDANIQFPRDNAKLQQIVEEHNVRLVILDSLMSFMETKRSLHGNYQAAVGAVMPFAEVCARIGVTVIGVMHLRKDADTASLNQIIGSVGISATARHILMVGNVPLEGAKVVGVVKSNLGPEGVGTLYDVDWVPVALDDQGRTITGSRITLGRPATEAEVHSMLEKAEKTPVSEQQNLTVLNAMADGVGRSRQELAEVCADAIDVDVRQFQRILGRLIDKGMVRDVRTGKGGAYSRQYHITDSGRAFAQAFSSPTEDEAPERIRKRRPFTVIDPDEED